MGCHPTRTTDFEKHKGGPEGYLKDLEDVISANLTGQGRVVALGELGLGMLSAINGYPGLGILLCVI